MEKQLEKDDKILSETKDNLMQRPIKKFSLFQYTSSLGFVVKKDHEYEDRKQHCGSSENNLKCQ